jgi:hypothetical protein
MKIFLFLCVSGHFLLNSDVSGQKHRDRINLDKWEKAVVNIETEGNFYTQHYMDSVLKTAGNDSIQLDSIRKAFAKATVSYTGTAIYVRDKNRRYLITAKHVLLDETLVDEKRYETRTGKNLWVDQDAIYPRISIRTPYQYYIDSGKQYNNMAVYTNNFVKGPKPYLFVSDPAGDGIGIISLQAKNYRLLDTTLTRNGYEPLTLEDIIPGRGDKEIKYLDSVFTIGFPEEISVVVKIPWIYPWAPFQSPDIVEQFTVGGQVAMYLPEFERFYVNITANPGNSGGPIIKDGKLIGIILGSNKNGVFDEKTRVQPIYGVGHLISIINTRVIPTSLKKFQRDEDKLLSTEN